jgi:hypothetical protein
MAHFERDARKTERSDGRGIEALEAASTILTQQMFKSGLLRKYYTIDFTR